MLSAGMAELADAHGSGPCDSNIMRVQVSFPAYYKSQKTSIYKFFETFVLHLIVFSTFLLHYNHKHFLFSVRKA